LLSSGNNINFIVKFGASVGKICVAIYAVLSGYGYYFAKEKNVRYGLRKIWGLLQVYWISLFTLFIPAAVLGGGGNLHPRRYLSNYLDCCLI
jgi:hypothetical protein